ncbi:hypothetical protein BJX70DRAFT_403875 [Aspergillus crustosus]
MSSEDDLLHSIRELLDPFSRRLRNERDSALHRLTEQQAELAIECENARVNAERTAELEEFLNAERSRSNRMENQLSVADDRNFTTEQTLRAISGLLARTEEENQETREQLRLRSQELNEANSSIVAAREHCAESLERLQQQLNDANSSIVAAREHCAESLERLQQQLNEANSSIATERETSARRLEELRQQRSERIALDGQLQERTAQLTTISNQLQEQMTRISELQQRLNQAIQFEDEMRIRNAELEARCTALREEVSELANARRTINQLWERQHAMDGEVRQLRAELGDEQTQRAELQSTVTAQSQEINELTEKLQELRSKLLDVNNANATLRRAKAMLVWWNFALRVRQRALRLELAELKTTISQMTGVKAKIPRYLGIARYKDSSAKM